ncbi:MAG: transporter substrate-binding domain-containing protein [SAR324 cluster bacterium]|nr:transporter substrate-binding domain-containing protein [SAR324 cluster bacterium]
MKLITRFISFLIISLSLIFTVYAEEIVISGNSAKAPKIWREDGQPKGILTDIMLYAGKELGVDFVIKLYPWKRAYTLAERSKAGIVGISKNEERLRIFDYSEPLYYDEVVLVVKRGNEFKYERNEDLKEKTIGACRGCTFGPEYEEAKKYFQVEPDNAKVKRLRKLLTGRIDAAIFNPGAAALNHELSLTKAFKRDQFTVLKKPITKDPNYLAFAKNLNMKDFLEKFNQVIQKGYEDGTIQKIIARY